MGLMQDLDTLLDAAGLLAAGCSAARFVLAGDGVLRPHIEERVRSEAITNVRLVPPQPRDAVPDLYFLADAALVSLVDRPLFEITIPSKTYEGMAAARPILCGVKGETRALVEGAGCGIAYEPGNPRSLVEAVCRLQAADRATLGTNGRRWVEANATRAMVTDAYLEVVEGVVR
jgi:glycosyltransferase involved in cell wall biosynthesis